MKANEMMEIGKLLRTVWKDMLTDDVTLRTWLDTFRNYDFATVCDATKDYIAHNRFKPVPADIIMLIPAKVAKDGPKRFVPKIERLPDGSTRRVISCRRCNDLGLITWEDADGCVIGRPCTCEAAYANYGAKLIEEAYQ